MIKVTVSIQCNTCGITKSWSSWAIYQINSLLARTIELSLKRNWQFIRNDKNELLGVVCANCSTRKEELR